MYKGVFPFFIPSLHALSLVISVPCSVTVGLVVDVTLLVDELSAVFSE